MYWYTPCKKVGNFVVNTEIEFSSHFSPNKCKHLEKLARDEKWFKKLVEVGKTGWNKELQKVGSFMKEFFLDVIYLLKIHWKFPYLNYDPGWFLGKLVLFYGTVRLSADTRLTPGLGFQRLPIPTSTVQLYSSVTGRDKVHVPHFAWIKTWLKNIFF